MYDNVGKKIKKLADVLFTIGYVGFSLLGCVILVAGLSRGNVFLIIVSIATIGLGILFSWLSSLFMAGFGELIDKTSKQYELSCLQAQLSAGLIENTEYVDKLTELGKVEATADKST